MAAALRDAGVPFESLETRRRAYGAERAAVRERLQRDRPDVVHTHGYRADVLHAPVARRQGIATVTTFHGFTGGDLKNRVFEFLQVRSARQTGCAVAVSRSIARRLARGGVEPGRIQCIPNARQPAPLLEREAARQRLGLRVKGSVFGWVGRMSPEKGADVLLNALARLPRESVTTVLLGDGPDVPLLQAKACELGLQQDVHFAGVVSGAAGYMTAFDALVLSSRTEGVPMVLVEAMQANVPIVTTRVGGVPDMLTDSEAFLVPAESPAALAEAMTDVLRRPAEAALRAARAARRAARDFGVATWVERYDRVYERAIRVGVATR